MALSTITTRGERMALQGEFYEIGRRLLEVVHEGKDGELDARCPFHGEDHRPSLRFNVDNGLWYCHRCHESGNANTLSLKLTGKAADRQSFDTAADVLEREIEEFERAQSRARATYVRAEVEETFSMHYKGSVRSVSTGSAVGVNGSISGSDGVKRNGAVNSKNGEYDEIGFSPVTIRTRQSRRHKAEDIDYAGLFGVAISGVRDLLVEETVLRRFKAPTDYWTEQRHFDPAWVDVFELGYDPLADAHTIPIRNQSGQLCGVNQRFANGDAKYKLPSGFERKRHLYGSWLYGKMKVDDPTTVVLVEGATDAIACWHVGYQGLAVYGSSVSEHQIKLLHRMGVRNVIMAFDDDKAGRECTAETWKLLPRFFAGKVSWPKHPRQRHNRQANGYDANELFVADADSLARTLDRVRLT